MDNIILASQSPRRQQLLTQAGITFQVVVSDVDEEQLPLLDVEKIPEYLAQLKAKTVAQKYPDALLIAADTLVILENEILSKPKSLIEAKTMLQKLSGKMHKVISGVCIGNDQKWITFSACTEVYFKALNIAQIEHYVQHYQPLDKAGAYAIQEWIGLIGIEKIVGDYYNVMGLPINLVIETLMKEFQIVFTDIKG